MEKLRNAVKNMNVFVLLANTFVVVATTDSKADGARNEANRFAQTLVFKGSVLANAAIAKSTNYELNPSTLPSGFGLESDLLCQIIMPPSIHCYAKFQAYLNMNSIGDPNEICDGINSRKP